MKKNGIVNSFIMGSNNQSGDKLPANRFEVFKEVFKNSYRKLMLLSLIIFFSSLPLFILILSKDIYLIYGKHDFNVSDEIRYFAINLACYTLAIPLIMIIFIALGGAFFIIRKLVWNEGVLFISDLKEGIKKCWKENLVFGFIFGLSLNVLISNLYFLQINLDVPKLLQYIIIFISIFQFLVIFIMILFSLTQAVIYKQQIRYILKNSLLFTIVKLPKNIMVLGLSLIPYILILVNVNFFLQFVFYIVAGIIGFAFSILIWTLYSHSIFDKYINKKHCPKIVNKGIK